MSDTLLSHAIGSKWENMCGYINEGVVPVLFKKIYETDLVYYSYIPYTVHKNNFVQYLDF